MIACALKASRALVPRTLRTAIGRNVHHSQDRRITPWPCEAGRAASKRRSRSLRSLLHTAALRRGVTAMLPAANLHACSAPLACPFCPQGWGPSSLAPLACGVHIPPANGAAGKHRCRCRCCCLPDASVCPAYGSPRCSVSVRSSSQGAITPGLQRDDRLHAISDIAIYEPSGSRRALRCRDGSGMRNLVTCTRVHWVDERGELANPTKERKKAIAIWLW